MSIFFLLLFHGTSILISLPAVEKHFDIRSWWNTYDSCSLLVVSDHMLQISSEIWDWPSAEDHTESKWCFFCCCCSEIRTVFFLRMYSLSCYKWLHYVLLKLDQSYASSQLVFRKSLIKYFTDQMCGIFFTKTIHIIHIWYKNFGVPSWAKVVPFWKNGPFFIHYFFQMKTVDPCWI